MAQSTFSVRMDESIKKQFDALDMYYNKDMSLSEIGESLGKTRQGVFEILKRGEEKILDLEEKLKCHEMSLRCEELKDALVLVVSLQNSNKYDEATAVAKEVLDKIIEEAGRNANENLLISRFSAETARILKERK